MKTIYEVVAERYQRVLEIRPKAQTLYDVPGTYESLT